MVSMVVGDTVGDRSRWRRLRSCVIAKAAERARSMCAAPSVLAPPPPAWRCAPAPRRPGRSGSATGRPAAGAPARVSMATNSPLISSMWLVRGAPSRPSRSRATTSPSERPRWHWSSYSSTSSNALPRMRVWSRMSSSRRSPAPQITTERRLAGMRFDGVHQRLDRVRVVAVVGDHGRALVVEHVEAARRVVALADEGVQAQADRVPVDADGPGRGHRGHRVLDLEADHAAAGDRHFATAGCALRACPAPRPGGRRRRRRCGGPARGASASAAASSPRRSR